MSPTAHRAKNEEKKQTTTNHSRSQPGAARVPNNASNKNGTTAPINGGQNAQDTDSAESRRIDRKIALRKQKEREHQALEDEYEKLREEILKLKAVGKYDVKSEVGKNFREISQKRKSIKRQILELDKEIKGLRQAQQYPTKRKATKQIKKKSQFDKLRNSVHPHAVDNFRPKHSFTVPSKNDESHYGHLTDQTSYAEYAWEFFRRNRFIQRGHDTNRGDPNKYAMSALTKNKNINIGISSHHHYKDRYDAQSSHQWWGIHTFLSQLKANPFVGPRQHSRHPPLEYPETQVELIFDLGPQLIDAEALIDVQLELARAYLYRLANNGNVKKTKAKRRPPNKPLLRAQLRVADLMSQPRQIGRAAKFAPSDFNLRTDQATPLKINQVANLLPPFDLKRQLNSTRVTERQRVNRASELAKGAWENIYGLRFLNWLQFDNWTPSVEAIFKQKSSSSNSSATPKKGPAALPSVTKRGRKASHSPAKTTLGAKRRS